MSVSHSRNPGRLGGRATELMPQHPIEGYHCANGAGPTTGCYRPQDDSKTKLDATSTTDGSSMSMAAMRDCRCAVGVSADIIDVVVEQDIICLNSVRRDQQLSRHFAEFHLHK